LKEAKAVAAHTAEEAQEAAAKAAKRAKKEAKKQAKVIPRRPRSSARTFTLAKTDFPTTDLSASQSAVAL
jgi:hypothetical protein